MVHDIHPLRPTEGKEYSMQPCTITITTQPPLFSLCPPFISSDTKSLYNQGLDSCYHHSPADNQAHFLIKLPTPCFCSLRMFLRKVTVSVHQSSISSRFSSSSTICLDKVCIAHWRAQSHSTGVLLSPPLSP